MLVVISDLHLGDGSATADDVPPEAFAMWLEDVLALARHNGARSIDLLYLGDIVDLLRTEYWFYPGPGVALPPTTEPESFPAADRPWGSATVNAGGGRPSGACVERARAIHARIRERCRDQLALLSGDLSRLSPAFRASSGALVPRLQQSLASFDVRRLYVPGNHDRLCLHDERLRNDVLEALGATLVPADEGGPHAYRSPRHGVIARHGHEWDVWNFEGFRQKQAIDNLLPAGFELVPVGDPITTELVARLPYATFFQLRDVGVAPEIALSVYSHLRQVEDVRPLHAAIQWVLARAQDVGRRWGGADQKRIVEALERAARDSVSRFLELPFVERWMDEHDHWNIGLDEADKLQGVCRLVRSVSLGSVEKVLGVGDQLRRWGLLSSDPTDGGAVREPLEREGGQGIRYCVYGHTHVYQHDPLSCGAAGDSRVYFNSGTWRPRVVETRDSHGFARFHEMTWLVFYDEGEGTVGDGARAPARRRQSYETWTGAMLDRLS